MSSSNTPTQPNDNFVPPNLGHISGFKYVCDQYKLDEQLCEQTIEDCLHHSWIGSSRSALGIFNPLYHICTPIIYAKTRLYAACHKFSSFLWGVGMDLCDILNDPLRSVSSFCVSSIFTIGAAFFDVLFALCGVGYCVLAIIFTVGGGVCFIIYNVPSMIGTVCKCIFQPVVNKASS